MLFKPFGAKQETSRSDNLVADVHAFQNNIAAFGLRAETNLPHHKNARFVGCQKHDFLIVNRLHGGTWNDRRGALRRSERAESDVDVLPDFENLIGVFEFNARLRRPRRLVKIRVNISYLTAKNSARKSVACHGRAAARADFS